MIFEKFFEKILLVKNKVPLTNKNFYNFGKESNKLTQAHMAYIYTPKIHNYCEFKYEMVDVEQLYENLADMHKYKCSWDKERNIIYIKRRDERNFPPDIRISCKNGFLYVTCQYSEIAYIFTYIISFVLLCMLLAFLLGEGDALYKIQGGFTILVFPILFNFFFNKISYSKY